MIAVPALEYWLWLSGAEQVSARAKAKLIRHYGGAEAAYYAPDGEFSSIDGIRPEEAAVLEQRDLRRAMRIADDCAQQGIQIITMQDAAYPKRLKNIYLPPAVLYVKGVLPLVDENALISVIGTRKATPYGLKMGRDIAYQIVRCGGIVVSGLTEGIDAQGAKGALIGGGKCVAVLGTPHEREAGRLAKDVEISGAVISEYPPGMEPQRIFFRERNRLAAGISVGVVVVEAPERSGTRLFAMEALEQGKEIFAVPGNADAENSVGTLALIKEGAKLVTDGMEVMSEFESLYPCRIKLTEKETAPDEKTPPETKERPAAPIKEDSQGKKSIDKGSDKGYIDLKTQLASLSEDQLKIITAIDKNATHIDDIIEATGLSTATVLAQLTLLEIRGFVRREAGRRISLNTAKK